MAGDFQEFAQQVARLAQESDTLRNALVELNANVLAAEQELQLRKTQRQTTNYRLLELESQQKALMGNFRQLAHRTPSTTKVPAFGLQSMTPGWSATPTTVSDGHDARQGTYSKSDERAMSVTNGDRVFDDGGSNGDHDGHTSTVNSIFSAHGMANPHVLTLPTSVPSKVDARTKGQSKDAPSLAKSIHPNFPTVVHLNGKWTDIACRHCGANAHIYAGVANFYRGVTGLTQHVRRNHDDTMDSSRAAADKNFKHRIVSDADAALLKAGKQPQSPIAMHFATDSHDRHPSKLSTPRKQTPQNQPPVGQPYSSSLSEAEVTQSRTEAPKRVLTEYEEFQQIESLSKTAALPADKKRKIDNAVGKRRQKQSPVQYNDGCDEGQ